MAARDDQGTEPRRAPEATDPNYPPPPDAGERASHPGSVAPASSKRGVDTAPGGIAAPPPASAPSSGPARAGLGDASIVIAPEALSPAAPAARIPGMNDSIDELMSGFAEPLLPRKRIAQSGGADQAAYQGTSRPAAAHQEANLPPIVVNREVDTGPGERSRDLDRTTLGGRKLRRRIVAAVLLPGIFVGLAALGVYYGVAGHFGAGASSPADTVAATTATTTNVRPLATGVVMPLGTDAVAPAPADTDLAPPGDTASSSKPQGRHPRPTQVYPRASTSEHGATPPESSSAAPASTKNDLLPHL